MSIFQLFIMPVLKKLTNIKKYLNKYDRKLLLFTVYVYSVECDIPREQCLMQVLPRESWARILAPAFINIEVISSLPTQLAKARTCSPAVT